MKSQKAKSGSLVPSVLHVGGRVPAAQAEAVAYVGIGDGSQHMFRAVITGCVREPAAWEHAETLVHRWNSQPQLLEALRDLLLWESATGGWEAPCWKRARKLVREASRHP